MNIVVVAATRAEIAPFLAYLDKHGNQAIQNAYKYKHHRIDILLTGVGSPATAFFMGSYLTGIPVDLAINAGIAGAIDKSLKLGEVVEIRTDQFADLGAEDSDGQFLDLVALGLEATPTYFEHPSPASLSDIRKVQAVTVNMVHGSEERITQLQERLPEAQIESMESAAFFMACMRMQVHFLAIRSISNYVEPRQRENWRIADAIANLNDKLIEIIDIVESLELRV